MTDLPLLHPEIQASIVLAVAKASEGPLFLRRVKGWATRPDVERLGITQRLRDGGWAWRIEGGDLVVTGSVV